MSSYHERLEPGLNRLTDSEWLPLASGVLPEVPWLEPVLGSPTTRAQPRYPGAQ